MADDLNQSELLKLLDSPGVKHELGRTLTKGVDKPLDDSRPYPQERVDAVTKACMSAIRAIKRRSY